MIETVEAGFCC